MARRAQGSKTAANSPEGGVKSVGSHRDTCGMTRKWCDPGGREDADSLEYVIDALTDVWEPQIPVDFSFVDFEIVCGSG